MSQQFCLHDTVLVNISSIDTTLDSFENQMQNQVNRYKLGIIQYIGIIDDVESGMPSADYVGIELVESIKNGHDGTLNGMQYFKCANGHGIYCHISNIIRKLPTIEVTKTLQEIIHLFKTRLNEYVEALSERDDYIEELKGTHRHLRALVAASKRKLTSITEESVNCNDNDKSPPLRRKSSPELYYTEDYNNINDHSQNEKLDENKHKKRKNKKKQRPEHRRRSSPLDYIPVYAGYSKYSSSGEKVFSSSVPSSRRTSKRTKEAKPILAKLSQSGPGPNANAKKSRKGKRKTKSCKTKTKKISVKFNPNQRQSMNSIAQRTSGAPGLVYSKSEPKRTQSNLIMNRMNMNRQSPNTANKPRAIAINTYQEQAHYTNNVTRHPQYPQMFMPEINTLAHPVVTPEASISPVTPTQNNEDVYIPSQLANGNGISTAYNYNNVSPQMYAQQMPSPHPVHTYEQSELPPLPEPARLADRVMTIFQQRQAMASLNTNNHGCSYGVNTNRDNGNTCNTCSYPSQSNQSLYLQSDGIEHVVPVPHQPQTTQAQSPYFGQMPMEKMNTEKNSKPVRKFRKPVPELHDYHYQMNNKFYNGSKSALDNINYNRRSGLRIHVNTNSNGNGNRNHSTSTPFRGQSHPQSRIPAQTGSYYYFKEDNVPQVMI